MFFLFLVVLLLDDEDDAEAVGIYNCYGAVLCRELWVDLAVSCLLLLHCSCCVVCAMSIGLCYLSFVMLLFLVCVLWEWGGGRFNKSCL